MSSKLLSPIFRLLPARGLAYIPIRSLQAPIARVVLPAFFSRARAWPRPLRSDSNQMSS